MDEAKNNDHRNIGLGIGSKALYSQTPIHAEMLLTVGDGSPDCHLHTGYPGGQELESSEPPNSTVMGGDRVAVSIKALTA